MPRVTVVIPTLDRLDFLRRSVASALGQTYEDLEVVVVDDGPSADVARFVRDHPDERLRLVQHSSNRGVPVARNTGIAAARGEYLAFLDDDDIWLPEKLERQIAVANGGAPIVHSLVYVADVAGRVYERCSERGFHLFREVAAAEYPYVWLFRRSSYQLGTFLVHRGCLDAVGGFDPDLPTVEDLDLVHRLRRRYELRLVDQPLSKYCRHEANASSRTDPRVWVRFMERELAWAAEAKPPGRREIEAYLWMQIAQAYWIAGEYRSLLAPAVRARQLDHSVITGRTVAKYAAAPLMPSSFVDALRGWARAVRSPAEPCPWLDLPAPLPAKRW